VLIGGDSRTAAFCSWVDCFEITLDSIEVEIASCSSAAIHVLLLFVL